MRRALVTFGGVVLLVVTVLGVRGTWDTDARASGLGKTVVAPVGGPRDGFVAEGRLLAYPDAEVTVGTEVAGTVERLPVFEKSVVRKGQLVVELRADDLRAAIAEAAAQADGAQADITLAEKAVARASQLVQHQVGTKQTLEQAEHDRDAGLARRRTAQAAVARLEAQLAKTRIVSPIDGVVTERIVQHGETVKAGDQLLTVANLARSRIEAEVDEFDAGHIRLGGEASVTAEGFGGAAWRAAVEEIPDEVVTRRMRPPDPSQPVDTRVLLVKLALREPVPLKLGQRVEVRFAPSGPGGPHGGRQTPEH
jgi:HlyD family secretion protein